MSILILIYVVITLICLATEAKWKFPASYLCSNIHRVMNDIGSDTFTPYHDDALTEIYWKKFSRHDLFKSRVTKIWVAVIWPIWVTGYFLLYCIMTTIFFIALVLGIFSDLRKES
ncbi:hypothetical protein BMS3Abin15_00997 [bacterium BMS3Abin15]|nr:hypothetical protein BMS3Abin15_00997 [bacterium BMS3Abin15]HDZ84943.1 hypothetical protein [Candidatus Moranbacteria bacterium]